MTGEVSDIDGGSKEKYGYKKFQIQIWEPMLFVTAECWAKSEADINKITSARMGQRLSISGEVWNYGDLIGLQLRNCSVL
jgi:hypothetical protein